MLHFVMCICSFWFLVISGWTESGEFLEYHFYIPSDDDFDIWVRVAANSPGKRIRIEVNPIGRVPYSKTFIVIDKGWQDFTDIVWDLLYLEENEYRLRIYFEDGQVNLCSVSVKDSTSRYYVYTPGTYSALFYADYTENTPNERSGNCPSPSWGTVDSLMVTDQVCMEAISEYAIPCAIGWTEPNEQLTYRFQTDGMHEYVNISFRVSSNNPSRRMEVVVYSANPTTYIINGPGRGWDAYGTITLEKVHVGTVRYHDIFVKFLDGKMNLCSFGVQYWEE